MITILDEFILHLVGTNLNYIRRHKLTYIRKQFFILIVYARKSLSTLLQVDILIYIKSSIITIPKYFFKH